MERDSKQAIEHLCDFLYSRINSNSCTQLELRQIQIFRSRLGFTNPQFSKHKWLATAPLQASLKALGEAFVSKFEADSLPNDSRLLTVANIWLEAPTSTTPDMWVRVVEKLDTMRSNFTSKETETLLNIYNKLISLHETGNHSFAAVASSIILLDRDCYTRFVNDHVVSNCASKTLALSCLQSPELYRGICADANVSHVAELVRSVQRYGSVAPLYLESEQHIVCMLEVDVQHLCHELKLRHYGNITNQLLQLFPVHLDSVLRLLSHFPAVFEFVCDFSETVPEAARLALRLLSLDPRDI